MGGVSTTVSDTVGLISTHITCRAHIGDDRSEWITLDAEKDKGQVGSEKLKKYVVRDG